MDLVPIGESKIERRILFAGKSAKNEKSTNCHHLVIRSYDWLYLEAKLI